MVITNSISITTKILSALFGAVFVFLFGLYVALMNGIKIDNLSYGDIQINKLYIKLDKKFTLIIDEYIDKSTKPSLFTINFTEGNINIAQQIIDEFDVIEIKKIYTKEFDGYAKIRNNIIDIQSKKFELLSTFTNKGKYYYFKLKKFNYKDKRILVFGNIATNIASKDIDSRLIIKYKNSQFNAKVNKKDEILSVDSSISSQQDLSLLKEFIDFDSDLNEWLLSRLSAESFDVSKIKFDYNLQKQRIAEDKLWLKGVAKNLSLKFNDKLESFKAKQAFVTIGNSNLSINFDSPTYLDKNFDGSTVLISSLFNAPKLKIELKHSGLFDKSIINILESYDIKMPNIYQSAGIADIFVKLNMDLNTNLNLKAYATAKSKNARFSIFDQTLDFKNLDLVYDKNIYLNNSLFRFKNFDVSVGNFEYNLDTDKFKFNANSNISKIGKVSVKAEGDAKTNLIEGFVNTAGFKIDNVLKLPEQDFKFLADFSTDLKIEIPELDAKYFSQNGDYFIWLDNLKTIMPYSDLGKKYKFSDGDIKLKTKNFEDYEFTGSVVEPDIPFEFKYKNKTIVKFNFAGEYKNQILKISDTHNLINLSYNKFPIIELNNLAISQLEPANLRDKFKNKKENKTLYEMLNTEFDLPKMKLFAHNCDFENFSEVKFDIDELSVDSDGKHLDVDAKIGKSKLIFKKHIDSIAFSGIKLDDNLLNTFFGKKKVQNGFVNIKASGTAKNLSGFADIYGMDLIGVSLVSNIQKGSFLFTFDTQTEIFEFNKLQTTSDVLDLVGHGKLNFKTKKIKSDFDIIFAKNISDGIRYIPIVGYLLFGKDSNIQMSATVAGDIEKPNVETHFIKGTSNAMISIIKRILMLPLDTIEFAGNAIKGE
jgi:hypothetical protein